MKDYWLAKLISFVEEVDSRKRLQKSIYLLQRAGCPLQCDYILHYYGPYSFELANLIDQLHGAEIIREEPEPTVFGDVRYRSKITPRGERVLAKFEEGKMGKDLKAQISKFENPFKTLNQKDLRVLELAATIAYFYERSWPEAIAQTGRFKHLEKDNMNLSKATEIAREVVAAR